MITRITMNMYFSEVEMIHIASLIITVEHLYTRWERKMNLFNVFGELLV